MPRSPGGQQGAQSRGVSPARLRIMEGDNTAGATGRVLARAIPRGEGPASGAKGQQVWMWAVEGLGGCAQAQHPSGWRGCRMPAGSRGPWGLEPVGTGWVGLGSDRPGELSEEWLEIRGCHSRGKCGTKAQCLQGESLTVGGVQESFPRGPGSSPAALGDRTERPGKELKWGWPGGEETLRTQGPGQTQTRKRTLGSGLWGSQ